MVARRRERLDVWQRAGRGLPSRTILEAATLRVERLGAGVAHRHVL